MVGLARAALGVLWTLYWAPAGGTPAGVPTWQPPFAESLARVQGIQRVRARMNQWLHSGTDYSSGERAGGSPASATWASTHAQEALQHCSQPGRLLQYNGGIKYWPDEGDGQAYGQQVSQARLHQHLMLSASVHSCAVDSSHLDDQAPASNHEHAVHASTPQINQQNDQSMDVVALRAIAPEPASPTSASPSRSTVNPAARSSSLASQLQTPSPAARLPMPSSTQLLWSGMQAQARMAAAPAAQGAAMLALLAAQRYIAARCGAKLANVLLALPWYALSILCAAGVVAGIGAAVFSLGK